MQELIILECGKRLLGGNGINVLWLSLSYIYTGF